ncbi:YkgJ family cysteine cluster protein [Cellvibrio sp. pealriver]|uniref:YkgJ family cysteine cluster protein n=1 Tax=Cellvibrio sp. pealriver TaxID=1622269 RepID=UPI0009E2A733|nr:YkgJ family cysteine cluster protein [Cellvibrio sp. pealriver]
MSSHFESPCLTCGACCASFRVSFYWGECQSAGGTVPDELIMKVTPHHVCMKGTEKSPVHCAALVGMPGERVSCSIYENRSSTCREFDIWNEDGTVNEACTRAREIYGLIPIGSVHLNQVTDETNRRLPH